jgi:flagellar M-ring protein FliF
MGGVGAATIGFFAFIAMRLAEPSYALLYANLDLQESGQIVSRLEQSKVPYRIAGNGAQILVPESQVLRLRMQLAENGLPSGGSVGYEIFDRSDAFGTTSFVQNINHLRALEGELARTVRAIDGVQSARVHLVLPRREVFSRDNRAPSASIVIKTRGGRIDKPQVRAIQNLVAAAVPDLKPSRIAVVDERGNLLAGGADEGDPAAAAVSNLAEIRRQHEERLKRAIETLLERSVGAGNVRAEVTADIDFDRIVTNSESYDPDGQVVRSTQTVSEDNQSSEAQPQNVTVASNLPENVAGAGANQAQSRGQRTEELVNYEISKTVKTQTREAGLVRRLSVAVLVNGVEAAAADGKRSYQPRGEEELKQLGALVRSAIGFDAKRGDTVEVVSLRFAEGEQIEAPPESFLGLEKSDYLRIGEVAGLLVLGLLALLLVVRPLVGRLLAGMRPVSAAQPARAGGNLALAGPEGEGPTAVLAEREPITVQRPAIEQMIDIARIEGQVKASSMKKIGEIVEKHPDEAAAIVRNWLYQGS